MSLYLVEIDSNDIFYKNREIELSIPIMVKVNKIHTAYFTDTAESIESKLECLKEIEDAISYADDEDVILENIRKILKEIKK